MTNTPIRLVVDSESKRFAVEVSELADPTRFEVVSYVDKPDALRDLISEADAVYIYKDHLDNEMIQSAKRLRFVQKFGVNCRNIDVEAATRKGIPVATLPLFRNAAVAEHAFALMITCARKIIAGHKSVEIGAYRELGLQPIRTTQREHRANWSQIMGISELKGAIVGIIGMGDIGMELTRRCQAFDMEVVYHQREPHPKQIETMLGLRYLDIDSLLSIADYVVLIIPQTPETERLIGRDQFERMKPTAVLINVARGGIVDEDALYEALVSDQIAMAGLDVFREEPLPVSSGLIGLPNVVLTPHTGGGSYLRRTDDRAAGLSNILSFFDGGKPSGIVNHNCI